jgi:hypothetical protein
MVGAEVRAGSASTLGWTLGVAASYTGTLLKKGLSASPDRFVIV